MRLLHIEKKVADPSAKLVAVCPKCAELRQGGVIGEVPHGLSGLGLRAHQDVWQSHADQLGHRVDVVYYQRHGEIAYSISTSRKEYLPRRPFQNIYSHKNF